MSDILKLVEGITDPSLELHFIIRMVLACICGAAIGLERSRRLKEAGIRTHIIVALGAALMMLVSKYGFFDVIGNGISLDASRIAANVITGISFLGAGVIFTKDASVRGLTTAAGIWATAGVGCAIGAGMYLSGVIATVLIVLIQIILHKHLISNETAVINQISITTEYSVSSIEQLKNNLEENGIQVLGCRIEKRDDGKITIDMSIKMNKSVSFDDVIRVIDDNEKYVLSMKDEKNGNIGE